MAANRAARRTQAARWAPARLTDPGPDPELGGHGPGDQEAGERRRAVRRRLVLPADDLHVPLALPQPRSLRRRDGRDAALVCPQRAVVRAAALRPEKPRLAGQARAHAPRVPAGV